MAFQGHPSPFFERRSDLPLRAFTGFALSPQLIGG